MQFTGTGGLGATSSGLAEFVIEIAIVLLAVFGVYKLARLIWAALSH